MNAASSDIARAQWLSLIWFTFLNKRKDWPKLGSIVQKKMTLNTRFYNFCIILFHLKIQNTMLVCLESLQFFCHGATRMSNLKGYLPNLLEITLLCQLFVFWDRDVKFWLQPCLFEPEKLMGSDFTQLDILNSKTAYFSIFRVKSRYQSLTQETNFLA